MTFDLDGTLVDTVEDLAAALNQILVELGLSPHPLDAVRSMVGGGLSKLLGRALAAHAAGLDALQQDAAAARLLELYAEKPAGQSSLYPGSARPCAICVWQASLAASAPTSRTPLPATCCRRLALAKPLAASWGTPRDCRKSRILPASTASWRASTPNRPPPSLVGDSATDVQSARAAGLAAIVLVSYGYTATPAHALGADAVIDTLYELPAALALLAGRRA